MSDRSSGKPELDLDDLPEYDRLTEDAIDLGYPECLSREKFSGWLEQASLRDLHSLLRELNAVRTGFLLDDANALRDILLNEESAHANFTDLELLKKRLNNIDVFVRGDFGLIRVDLLFPEFDEIRNTVIESIGSSPKSVWDKGHSFLSENWRNPAGPSQLDALTYVSRHDDTHIRSQEVRDILYEWSTRIIIRGDGDEELADRAIKGDLSVGEIQAYWEEEHVYPYYIWSPHSGESIVCDGTVQRLAAEFDVSEFEFWISATSEEFTDGPVGELDQTRGLMWIFWTLFGAPSLIDETSDRTLKMWGWALENCGLENQAPWVVREGIDDEGNVRFLNSVLIASSILYSGSVVEELQISTDTMLSAEQFVLEAQKKNGGWGRYLKDSFSVLATTMAAWALHESGNHSDRVQRALDRLSRAANEGGAWSDRNFPPFTLTAAILELYHSFSSSSTAATTTKDESMDRRFKVAFTFPGEARSVVRPIAEELASRIGKENVFYDEFFEAELSRIDLDVYLQKIYRHNSDLIVPFFDENYSEKDWCGLEWRAVREIIKSGESGRIMLFKVDEFDVPGIFSLDGYADVRNKTPEESAELIMTRLETL